MTPDDRHQPQREIATISFGNPTIITIYYNAAAPTPKTGRTKKTSFFARWSFNCTKYWNMVPNSWTWPSRLIRKTRSWHAGHSTRMVQREPAPNSNVQNTISSNSFAFLQVCFQDVSVLQLLIIFVQRLQTLEIHQFIFDEIFRNFSIFKTEQIKIS